jgi:hypothetical protein
MKQIKDIAILRNEGGSYQLKFPYLHKIILQSIDMFCKVEGKLIDEVTLEIIIRKVQKKKTREQLGYLYASVLPSFYWYMREQGSTSSNDSLKDMLKLHPEIDYCNEEVNCLTGEILKKPKSFALATREEMSEIIIKLIRLGADFGIEIESAEDFKERCYIT